MRGYSGTFLHDRRKEQTSPDDHNTRSHKQALLGVQSITRKWGDAPTIAYYRYGQPTSHFAPSSIPSHALQQEELIFPPRSNPSPTTTQTYTTDSTCYLLRAILSMYSTQHKNPSQITNNNNNSKRLPMMHDAKR